MDNARAHTVLHDTPAAADIPSRNEPPGIMDVYFPPASSIALWDQQKPNTRTGAGLCLGLGILAILLFFTFVAGPLLGIPSVILGHRALRRIRHTGTRRQQGLALTGLIAGYTGIGLSALLTFAIYRFSEDMGRRRATKTEGNVATLVSFLQIYSTKQSGQPPSMEAGLRDLIIKRVLTDESLLTDPWGEPIHYKIPGTRAKDGFDIWSSGPDLISGTDDDIGNWTQAD